MLNDQLDILSHSKRKQIKKEIDGIQSQLDASVIQKRILAKQVKKTKSFYLMPV